MIVRVKSEVSEDDESEVSEGVNEGTGSEGVVKLILRM